MPPLHYIQAELKLQAGKVDAAWAVLEAGNAASRNDPPPVYPQSIIRGNPELFGNSSGPPELTAWPHIISLRLDTYHRLPLTFIGFGGRTQ